MQKRLMVKPLVLLALCAVMLGWPLTAAAPTARPEEVGFSAERLKRVTELMQRHVDAKAMSGAVTLVARNGRIAHLEAHGLMDLESRKPMQKDAIFRIMSMTKPMVGVAVLMMMEEGKVRLNDPISRFIPEYKDLKVGVPQGGPAPAGRAGGPPAAPRFYTVPAEREVTVRDVLTHTSGIVSGTISNSEERKVSATPTDSLATYLPRLGQVPLEFQPGSRWAYSAGAGFETLGRVIEIASGMPLDRFFRTRIFDPLGMKDITFWPTDAQMPRVASVYQRTATGLTKAATPNDTSSRNVYFRGSGGLYSTAEDYIPLGIMLAGKGEMNGKRLLSRKTVEMLAAAHVLDTLPGRPAGEGYGLSVRVVTDHAARNTMLSDGTFGWTGAQGTHFFVDPKEELTAVLMVQTSNGEIQRDFEDLVAQSIVD